MNKKGAYYCKTNNIIKAEKELLKLNHTLMNIRHIYLHQIVYCKSRYDEEGMKHKVLYNFYRLL